MSLRLALALVALVLLAGCVVALVVAAQRAKRARPFARLAPFARYAAVRRLRA